MFFATAYNRFGEGKPWKQERVRQFFSDDELLIGKDFWDFVCKSDEGYKIVLDAYKNVTKRLKYKKIRNDFTISRNFNNISYFLKNKLEQVY